MTNTPAPKKEVPSVLPEFEAVLMDASFYNLDRTTIKRLLEEKLRQIVDFDTIKFLKTKDGNPVFFRDSGRVYTYSERLSNVWLDELFTLLRDNEKFRNYRDSWYWSGNGTKIGIDPFLNSNSNYVLFWIDAIFFQRDCIVIKATSQKGKYGVWKGKIAEFLTSWLAALTETYKGDLPENTVYASTSANSQKEFWSYRLQHVIWQNLRIESENWTQLTIPATWWYDTLPREKWKVDVDVVVTFKPTYVEFWELLSSWKSQHLKQQKFYHKSVDHVDYGKHGNLIQWRLDPNKNFVVGIFEQNGVKSLKIIRLDNDATLMYEFADIEEIVWFDRADIVCYDTSGKLRNIDCNFDGFSIYSEDEIVSLAGDEEWELHKISGWCDSREQVFLSERFTKILWSVLSRSHPTVLNKASVTNLLDKVRTNDLLTISERDTLLLLVDPDISHNKKVLDQWGNFLGRVELLTTKPKTKDALLKLLSDSSASEIFGAYMKKLVEYKHVLDVDCIHIFGSDLRLLEKDWKKWVFVKEDDAFIELMAIEYDVMDIQSLWNDTRKIETVQGTQKTTLTYTVGQGVTDEVVSDDAYKDAPVFDSNWCGVVTLKAGGMVFVRKNNKIIAQVDGGPYTNIETIHWAYLVTQEKKVSIAVSNEAGAIVFNEHDFLQYDKRKNTPLYKNDTWGALLVTAENGKDLLIVSRNSEGNISEQYIVWWTVPSKVGENNLSNNVDTFVAKWKIILWDNENTYTPFCVKENGLVERRTSYNSLRYANWEDGFIGSTDASWDMVCIEQCRESIWYEMIYEGPVLSKQQKPLCVYYQDDENILSATWIQEGRIHTYSYEELATTFSTSQTSIQKVKLWKKDFCLAFFFADSVCKKIEVTDYQDVWEEQKYGDYVYQWFFRGDKYWILCKKGGWFEVYKEAISDEEPVFWTEGIAFGDDQFVVNEWNLELLEHDFDTIEMIPSIWTYLICKGSKWWFGKKEGKKIVAIGELNLGSKPELFDNTYLTVQVWDMYQLYKLDAWVTLPWTLLQTYKVKPVYHGYDIFTLPVEWGFFLVNPRDAFKHYPTEYKWTLHITRNNNTDYTKLDTGAGSHWLLVDGDNLERWLPQLVFWDTKGHCVQISVENVYMERGHCFIYGSEQGKEGRWRWLYYVNGWMMKRLSDKPWVKESWKQTYRNNRPYLCYQDEEKILFRLRDGWGDEYETAYVQFGCGELVSVNRTKERLTMWKIDDSKESMGVIKVKWFMWSRRDLEWEYVSVI